MKNNNKKSVIMAVLIVIFCVLMAVIDGVFKADYFIKSIIKLVLFLILPAVYSFYDKDIRIKEILRPRKSGIKTAMFLCVLVYVIILGGYLLVKNIFDFSAITGNLTANAGITADNFIYVAAYISFVNSFLEEFFFRGFAFITLKNQTNRTFAYVLSAALFSIYHAGMTTGWYHPIVFVLGLIVLFIGGCIFNYLNEKCDNIYPSWLVHMFANFALNTVGFVLFGVL